MKENDILKQRVAPARPGAHAGWAAGLLLSVCAFACGASDAMAAAPSSPTITQAALAALVQPEASRMWMTIGEKRYALTLSNTEAARAFAATLPLTIDMSDLNNNEKKADVAPGLPVNAARPGTIHNGDLMLYGSRTLVLFYQTFDSIYSYTRIGRVNAPQGLEQVLGAGNVRVTFSRD